MSDQEHPVRAAIDELAKAVQEPKHQWFESPDGSPTRNPDTAVLDVWSSAFPESLRKPIHKLMLLLGIRGKVKRQVFYQYLIPPAVQAALVTMVRDPDDDTSRHAEGWKTGEDLRLFWDAVDLLDDCLWKPKRYRDLDRERAFMVPVVYSDREDLPEINGDGGVVYHGPERPSGANKIAHKILLLFGIEPTPKMVERQYLKRYEVPLAAIQEINTLARCRHSNKWRNRCQDDVMYSPDNPDHDALRVPGKELWKWAKHHAYYDDGHPAPPVFDVKDFRR